ncbi:MAG: XisI protein [bacterium]|nr:XisI protein [bacterium]
MDSAGINFYQKCIKTLLSEYEDLQTEWSSVETLFDDERMRYMALRLGWNDQRRIHLCLIHIDIQDGMVIIQANNTEDALDGALVQLYSITISLLLGRFNEMAVQNTIHFSCTHMIAT